MRRLTFVAAALGLLWMAVPKGQGTLPVVPGAEGFGMGTRAAYACGSNPTIYKVTSLADDGGTGTFRYALEHSGPRVVIFETSGMITLGSAIHVGAPCLTVAGQTAPHPGITLRDYGLQINSHDILIQHLRIRLGDQTPLEPNGPGSEYDGIMVYGDTAHDVVIDHNSISWASSKSLGAVGVASPANITWRRNIYAEALYHPSNIGQTFENVSSLGLLIYPLTVNVTASENLSAHVNDRNPEAQEGAEFQFINNVVYDWGGDVVYNPMATMFYNGGRFPNSPFKAVVAGNKYIASANSVPNGLEAITVYSAWGGSQLYKADNVVDSALRSVTPYVNASAVSDGSMLVGSPPASLGGLTIRPSSGIEAFVLGNAGARPADRDVVDIRIVQEVTNRTGHIIASQNEVGGWPSLAINSRALTTPSNAHTVQASGYTALEEWLHQYAGIVEGDAVPDPGPDDVTPAHGSVFVSASFTGPSTTPLTSVINDIGGGWAFQVGSTGVLRLDDAGRLMSDATNEGALTLADGQPITPEYDIDLDARVLTLISGSSYGIWGRASPTAVTGYFFSLDVDSATLSIVRVVDADYVTLTSCSVTLTPSTTPHFTFRVRNTSQHALVSGTQCTSTSDHMITAPGRVGLSAYGPTADTTTTGVHFDNLVVTDVSHSIRAGLTGAGR